MLGNGDGRYIKDKTTPFLVIKDNICHIFMSYMVESAQMDKNNSTYSKIAHDIYDYLLDAILLALPHDQPLAHHVALVVWFYHIYIYIYKL